MNEARITYLFYRHFEGTSTTQEKEELAAMMQDPLYQADILELMEDAWQSYREEEPVFSDTKSKLLLTEILNHPMPDESVQPDNQIHGTSFWKRIAAAAVFILVAGLGYFYVKQERFEPLVETELVQDILPGMNKASLTLHDGSILNLDGLDNGIILNQKDISVLKTSDGQLVYQITGKADNDNSSLHELVTPRGGQYMVVLPDGSKAWLNAASSIKFPVIFNEKSRKVEVTGEVYFDIKKSLTQNGRLRPFLVKANEAEIEVLGTQFNINTYNNPTQVRTTLVEGSVKIHKGNLAELLKPGQEATISQTSPMIQINEADTERAVAWKKGYFQFEKTPLQEVMLQLSNWYDVDVNYEGTIPERAFSGEISRSTTLSQVLEILAISNIQLNRNDKKIIIKN